MVEPARQLMHLLVQRAAKRDVQLLQPATDREQRHRPIECPADQRQRGRIARRIARIVVPDRSPAVVMRLDVGRAAGDQQPVELVQKAIDVEARTERRDQQRQTARTVDHAVDVLGADLMEAEALADAEAGRNTDDG